MIPMSNHAKRHGAEVLQLPRRGIPQRWKGLAPGIGQGDVGGVEGLEGGAAEEAESAVDAFAEDLEGVGDSGFACGAEAVGVSPTDENGASAEANGFDDV